MGELLKDKIALVTGGSKGIGLAITRKLLSEGASVAICGRDTEALESSSAALALEFPSGDPQSANRLLALRADVSRLEDVRSLIKAVRDRFGRLDVLVNNAGLGVFKPVAELGPEEWHAMIDTNLSGVYYCCHEALPLMKESGGGFIFNIGSLAGRNTFAGGAGYNASKFGLVGFSEAMMLDHRHDRIRISCIMPGSVDTEFGRSGTGKPWKIQPEDIAETVVHLLAMPERTLISRVEVRPSMPPR
jgi:3-oxoacyl-[acyl-carrier protein] reductase